MDCLFNFSKDGLKISLSLLNSFNKTKVAIFPMQTMVPVLTFSPANFTKLNDIPFYFEVKADCRLYLSLSCFKWNYIL